MGFVRTTVLLAAFLLAFAASALASGTKINHIVVQGSQRIEVDTVKSYLSIAEGDAYDADRVDRSLKTLFNTGLFADVNIRQEGDSLIVRVVENPIINRMAFEGAKRIKDEQLKAEVQLRPRVVYTRAKVLSDVKRILDLYRREGRFAATVEPKLIQLDQNRVDLVFEINEGPATYVKKINFVGNHFYGESKLQDVLMTKEERWYRFLTTDDTYDPDRLTYDRELLRRFYLKHGFADFRVTSAVAELTPDGQGFFITVTLNEGERYKIGSADVKVALKGVNPDDLRPLVKCEPGDWYNGEEVEAATQKLTDAVGSKGYAFVDVRPQVKRNPDTRTVDVVYEVGEGPRVYVDRIDITGNVRTLDKVIRREFTLVEGDAFNTAKLRRSQQRIKDLNFFEKVDVSNVPSENAPDRTVIKVDVTEKSTGELSFGVGWSTVAGPLIETSLRERNLLGRGQDLGAKVSLGTMQNNFDLSFTEPYFLDRRLTAGADAFAIERHIQATAGYDSNTVGFDLRTGYHISEDLTQGWKYVLREDEIKNVNSGASMYIQEQSGLATTSLLEHSLMYDRRDSKVDPTEGYFLRMVNDIAGLGGSQDFVRNSFDVGNYYSVADQTVLSLTGTVGVIEGFAGKTVRITDRYYLGGDTMRGFQTYGVSPRDAGTGDPLGGSWEYRGTAQLQFPLGLPQEFGVGGRLFTDVGAVGDTPDSQSTAVDQSAMPRVTVGTGLSWKSPMGPVAVDIGMPLVKQSYDKTQIFHFSFGTKF